jgi:hypothetical protein
MLGRISLFRGVLDVAASRLQQARWPVTAYTQSGHLASRHAPRARASLHHRRRSLSLAMNGQEVSEDR